MNNGKQWPYIVAIKFLHCTKVDHDLLAATCPAVAKQSEGFVNDHQRHLNLQDFLLNLCNVKLSGYISSSGTLKAPAAQECPVLGDIHVGACRDSC